MSSSPISRIRVCGVSLPAWWRVTVNEKLASGTASCLPAIIPAATCPGREATGRHVTAVRRIRTAPSPSLTHRRGSVGAGPESVAGDLDHALLGCAVASAREAPGDEGLDVGAVGVAANGSGVLGLGEQVGQGG